MKANKIIAAAGIALFGAVLAFMIIALQPSSAAMATTTAPLDGTWHQNSNDTSGVSMVAEISGNHIQITMSANDLSGTYWDGTFDTGNKSGNSFNVVSKVNESAMNDMLASSDNTKKFTFKDGDLSYKFTILGTTTTIHLSRGE